MGRRKTDPAEARTTFELNGLTVPSPRTTPALPKASDERRMVPRLPGSCKPARTTIGPTCRRSDDIVERKFFQADERGHALRGFAGNEAVEQFVGKQKGFDLSADLRQEAVGAVLRGLAKEYRTETQAAADGFFQNAQAFDGTVSGFGEFGSAKTPGAVA